MKEFRSRKSLAHQLGGVLYAADLLVRDKGRAAGEFCAMPKKLQEDFIRFIGFTEVLKKRYETFLIEKPGDRPKYLQKYLEEYNDVAGR